MHVCRRSPKFGGRKGRNILNALLAILTTLGRFNSALLAFGRTLGFAALALMVCAILIQIFFRYVLNDALPWPEEAARGLMIWMMALVAPSAYRHAGFVSIEMVPDMLPNKWRHALILAILLLSSLVIFFLLVFAWKQYATPILFDSSGLNRLLQDSGINELLGVKLQFRTAYIFLAMVVLMIALLLVSIELILGQIGRLIWSEENFPPLQKPLTMADI